MLVGKPLATNLVWNYHSKFTYFFCITVNLVLGINNIFEKILSYNRPYLLLFHIQLYRTNSVFGNLGNSSRNWKPIFSFRHKTEIRKRMCCVCVCSREEIIHFARTLSESDPGGICESQTSTAANSSHSKWRNGCLLRGTHVNVCTCVFLRMFEHYVAPIHQSGHVLWNFMSDLYAWPDSTKTYLHNRRPPI